MSTFNWRLPWLVTGLLVTVLVCGRPFAKADDATWPQFRGPQSNPVAENPRLPDHWSLTENVEWSAEIPGRGWSSPVVVDGKIFLTTTVTDGPSKSPQPGTEFSNDYVAELTQQGLSEEEIVKKVTERDIELPEEVSLKYVLYCLDLETGKELWQREYHQGNPPTGRHRKNSFTSETPVSDGKAIYVYAGNLGLFAFDLSGNPLWHQSIDPHKIYFDFGTGSSPILCDNRLIVLNQNEEDSYLAAWDASSGEPLWRVNRNVEEGGQPIMSKSGWVTPYLWRNSLRTEIITVGTMQLVSYDLDGNVLWTMKGMGMGLAASSFAVGDSLMVNGGRGRPIFLVRPGASGDISLAPDETSNEYVIWSRPRSGTYIPTPVAYDGGLYILADNGIFTRLDLASGEESYKVRIKGTDADFTSSPWAYGGKIFLASEQGDIYVIKAGPEYELLHVNTVGELAMATPAIVGDRLLFRTENRIMSIRRATAN